MSLFLERRRIRFADPSSAAPATASVSRWSDNIPNEVSEFGTPVTVSAPPQYNTVRSLSAREEKKSIFFIFVGTTVDNATTISTTSTWFVDRVLLLSKIQMPLCI